jgi:hypothetical protein
MTTIEPNKFRLRRNMFGKLILQVLVYENHTGTVGGYIEDWTSCKWKDAKISDIETVCLLNNLCVV